jgi:large subunit ribosomal protein L20
MSRVTAGPAQKARHKKVLERAKGFRGRSSTCYRIAHERTEKAMQYAYRDRRAKKRIFRNLWVQRINAAARECGLTYSQLIGGLTKAAIAVDRKMLSELAVNDVAAFQAIAEKAKGALAAKAA